MTTWILVLFLWSNPPAKVDDPIVIPGFASKDACASAATALMDAQKRTGVSTCVEVKPAPCGGSTLYYRDAMPVVPWGGR